MKIRLIHIIFLFFTILVFSACRRDNRHRVHQGFVDEPEIFSENQENSNSNLETASELWMQPDLDLLIPSMSGNVPSQILKRIGYITSYNHDTKCPNWVAWHLTADRCDGNFSRRGVPYYDEDGIVIGIGLVTSETQHGNYILDQEAEEPRQLLSDWPNNEYDMSHGHICPAGDNKWSKAAMNQSFLLTNMCPQSEKLNGGAWKKLEEKCRIWAKQFCDIFIVAGPVYSEGIVSRTIGESKVAVPDAYFKVILYKGNSCNTVGFLYLNDDSSQPMRHAVRTVDEIEELTGFDFFSCIPDDIEDKIENRCDLNFWSIN